MKWGEIMKPSRISSLNKLANNQGHYYSNSLINCVLIKVSPLLTETTLSIVNTVLLGTAHPSTWTQEVGLKEICIEYEIQSFWDGMWGPKQGSLLPPSNTCSFIHSLCLELPWPFSPFLQAFALAKSSFQIPLWHSLTLSLWLCLLTIVSELGWLVHLHQYNVSCPRAQGLTLC